MPVLHIHERLGTLVAGRYRLRRIIGEGGMGAVFEAEVVPGGQRVAVKLIKPEYSSSQEVNARFVQEARAAASIGHPNIPAVLDAGTDDEGPYLVLELLKGETLADLLDRRAAGPREALLIAAETVDALRAAHAVGVVHRDIKPENIFLVGGADVRSEVKLLDFGISKILTEQALGGGLTRVGTAVGTPDYMSPEQASGNRVDGRADLWSLGAVMYEAISLKTPFTGESYQQLLSRILLHPHEPLAAVVPAVHPEVSALIDRALQKEPANRFPDASAMLAEIRRVLAVVPPDESLGMRADDSTGPFGSEATRVYEVPTGRARRRSRAGSSGTKQSVVAPPPELHVAPPVVMSALPQVSSSLPPAPQLSVAPMPPMSLPPMGFAPPAAPRFVAEAHEVPASVAAIAGAEPAPPRRALLAFAAVGTAVLVVAALFTLRGAPSPRAAAMHLATPDADAPPAVAAPHAPPASHDAGLAAMPVVQQMLQRPTASPPPRPTRAPERPAERAPERGDSVERAPRTRDVPAAQGPAGTALNSSEFLAAVGPSMPRISRCLHGLGGTVDVGVDIDDRGRLTRSTFRRPPDGSDEARCIERVLRGTRFPRNRPTTTRLYSNVR